VPHSEPWRSRTADSLGHHATEILIASIVAFVLVSLKPLPGALMMTVPITLFGVVLLTFVLMRQHDRRLCEQCMLSMPLNPAQRAARYKRRFWMVHTGSEPRYMIAFTVALIGSNFLTSAFGRLCWAVIYLSTAYLVLAYDTHRKLQPWCPWCSEDGGGDHVEDVPPVLTPDDRQRV
jgi:hypothetical protein